MLTDRDLKPENFLFSKKEDLTSLYLIDFGLAKKYKQGMSKLKTKAGTV
jgi:calcium-dependent protein kinase